MSESAKSNIKEPEVNYVTIEIKKMKRDENGHIFEVVEEQQVPDFIADILMGNQLIDTEK
ncbi:hypothetical protein [Blautia obeum]|uniref:Uncharacterized protein n=1 Tax=Blautia obeum TaxID=40520 RepID=A0A411ZR83_9FIRM|nr:hypothetical protein [Blautia obeum]RGQ05275.1 hypothetical protein DWZ12_08045 [Blautia obeum]